MMKLVLSGFVVSAALLVGGGDDAAIKKERAKFKGTWKITKFETSKGEEKKDDVTITVKFAEDGGVEFMMSKGTDTKSKKGTYKLNPTAKPKELDLIPEEKNDDVGKAIYQFDKDKLKLCLTEGKGSSRPTDFNIKEGSRTIIVTLERVK